MIANQSCITAANGDANKQLDKKSIKNMQIINEGKGILKKISRSLEE
jgi:hypothetical protein